MLSFFIIDNESYQIKSYNIIKQIKITENLDIIRNIFEKMLKINYNTNESYYYKTIYFSSIIIQALINFDNINIYLCISEKNNNYKNQIKFNKLLLLHSAISYRNIYYKLSKFLPNNKNLFPTIYSEIFIVPFLNNLNKILTLTSKKIDLVLFGNSEYISTMVLDLENKEIIYDTGYLVQKNYRTSILDISKKNEIMDEIYFFGQKLKNNYLKSNDKNLDKIENCIKLELRATFPKPLLMIRFYPLLKGVLLVHVFHQYKLSKIQILNPVMNEDYLYEKYKEIDITFFDLLKEIEEFNAKEVILIEKFFFEYFLILGSNIKEIGKNTNFNKNLMTYKSKDFDLIYLNKQILQMIKSCIAQFQFIKNKTDNDLINRIKKILGEEYEKYRKEDINNTNGNININNNLKITKNILEFPFIDFIKEFDLKKIFIKDIKEEKEGEENNNSITIINENDINIRIKDDESNVDEYSNLNLSKDNLDLVKRTIITSATRQNLISKTNSKSNTNTNSNTNLINYEINENIYRNYDLFNPETRNTKTEEEKKEYPLNKDEPFKIDITNIQNNIIENSKEESELKSILTPKE